MKLGGFVSSDARAAYDAVYERGLASLPAPVAQYDEPTRFGTVRVYRFGPSEGEPVVLLHGRLGTSVMWKKNIPVFTRTGPVYTVDLLGEPGRSVQTEPVRDAVDQAAWLEEVLVGLGLEGVHLVGYSFGGWVAMNFAIRRPGRLASVSVVDPVQTLAPLPVASILRTTLVLIPGLGRWTRPAFTRWISGGMEAAEGDPVAAVIEEGMGAYRIALPVPRLFTDEQLRGVRVPALAVIAGRSVLHDVDRAADRARTLLPDSEVEVWPEATHAAIGPEIGARVTEFIAGLGVRR